MTLKLNKQYKDFHITFLSLLYLGVSVSQLIEHALQHQDFGCKSFWIKVSAKCVNVNAGISQQIMIFQLVNQDFV